MVDYLDNPPAKKFADYFFQISTLDDDSIYGLAIKHRIELITTACTDQALLTMANVSEKLNLPCYLNAKTAKNVTDKAYMKKKMQENVKCKYYESVCKSYFRRYIRNCTTTMFKEGNGIRLCICIQRKST